VDQDRAAGYPFVPGTPPLTIAGAEGNHLITTDGRRILDGAGGAIVNCIGWGRPEMAEAAAAALTGAGYTLPTFATEARLSLVERLVDHWLPPEITRCLFVGGGSESVDSAIRITRQHHVANGNTDKWKVLGREVSYHGATLAALSVSNHDRRRAGMGPLLMDLPKIDNLDADQAIKTIEAEDPSTVGAVIAEPVVGASGAAIVAPDDYWPKLRSYCTQHDILLIADEVMTGIGRTGKNFGVNHWDVTPDIIVGSKGLAGGYAAIGGVFATDAVVEPLIGSTVMYFTFSGNDLACALADRTLRIIEDEDLVERARTQGAKLRTMLETRFGDHPNVSDIRGLGLLQGIELGGDGGSFDGSLTPLVVEEALARDCWIYPAGSAGVPDGLLFGPSYTVTDEELERIVDITAASLDAALARVPSAR
jgi:adenosylmethionine-8-amino-7-oxononanoate aminotransferase